MTKGGHFDLRRACLEEDSGTGVKRRSRSKYVVN